MTALHKRGGELCYKNKCLNKTTQDLYWFGLPDLRPVLNHPGRVPPHPQVLERVHLEPLQPQVLNGITCNLTTTSFTQGSLATFLTSSPLQPARVQPLQIKDFLTKFSSRTDSVTHLSTMNALNTRRDLTTKSTR